MIVSINKPSCYETKRFVKKGELLISKESDFNITEGRVYVAVKNQGEGTFADCICVVNDKGVQENYTSEYFCHYEGELVSSDF